MNCPKCKREIPYDSNLCCYCGNTIREICDECGKTELIGRRVCESKLHEAHKEKQVFIKQAKGFFNLEKGILFFSFILFMMAAAICVTYLLNSIGATKWLTAFSGGFTFCIFFFILLVIETKRDKRAEKLFEKKFPHYAEIIKKTGEK